MLGAVGLCYNLSTLSQHSNRLGLASDETYRVVVTIAAGYIQITTVILVYTHRLVLYHLY